jgi:hypothetical protein
MRNGQSVENVASELNVSPARLQRLLFAIGKRKVAKDQAECTTRRLRDQAIASSTRRLANSTDPELKIEIDATD